MQATASGCKPVVIQVQKDADPDCVRIMGKVFGEIVPQSKLDGLIIAANWRPEDVQALHGTLMKINGSVPIWVIGPIVKYDSALPRLLAVADRRGDASFVTKHRLDAENLDRDLEQASQVTGVRYVSLQRLMCPAGRCYEIDQAGAPLQFDYGHLTQAGSKFVARLLAREIFGFATKPAVGNG